MISWLIFLHLILLYVFNYYIFYGKNVISTVMLHYSNLILSSRNGSTRVRVNINEFYEKQITLDECPYEH